MMDMAHVSGSHGSIWTEGAGIKIADKNGTRDYEIPDDLALPPPPPVGGSDPRHQEERWKMLVGMELAPYTMLCRAFRAAIHGEASPSPVVPATFADGVAAMEIIDAFRASAAGGGKVVEV